MDESRCLLVYKSSPKVPSDDNGGRQVTLCTGERIGSRGSLKEEEGEEDEDFGPNSSVMVLGVNTKGLECGEDD